MAEYYRILSYLYRYDKRIRWIAKDSSKQSRKRMD